MATGTFAGYGTAQSAWEGVVGSSSSSSGSGRGTNVVVDRLEEVEWNGRSQKAHDVAIDGWIDWKGGMTTDGRDFAA